MGNSQQDPKILIRLLRIFTDSLIEWIDSLPNKFSDDEIGRRVKERTLMHRNKMIGAGLIMVIATIEGEIKKKYGLPYPIPRNIPHYTYRPYIRIIDYLIHTSDRRMTWYGWEELENIYRIRHCFVHNLGYLIRGHDIHIRNFLNRLSQGQIKDRNGNSVRPYYNLSQAGEILLETDILYRLRVLSADLLKSLNILQ